MFVIDYNTYRTVQAFNTRVRFLVFHYTALDFSTSIKALTGKAVSAHYLIPNPSDPSYLDAGFKELKIFNLVDEQARAWHAGVSDWRGRNNLNDTSIGIEIVNQASEKDGIFTFPEYQPQQIEAVIALAKNIIQRYPEIIPAHVIGHSDINFINKSDPGPRFPWHQLYQNGIGIWYDEAQKREYLPQYQFQLMAREFILAILRGYGYKAPDDISEKNFQLLIRAFQMHFRPSNFDGKVDAETCAILAALQKKYGFAKS